MNYPKGIVKNNNKIISYGNRGIKLEEDINITNEYYLINDIAVIHKKPVSITLSKVSYPSRKEAVIKEGYFKTPSTTDYNGIYKGKYIDFEAKETKGEAFPFANIHKHQLEHLKNICSHGGIGFIIIRFTKYNETYFVAYNIIEDFVSNNSRKSIPYEYIKENGHLIPINYNPRLDYLKIIDKYYLGGI